MKNGDMPAMPQTGFSDLDGDRFVSKDCGGAGLTKREQFAMAAMQGLAANGRSNGNMYETAARMAVRQADAVLAELEHTSGGES